MGAARGLYAPPGGRNHPRMKKRAQQALSEAKTCQEPTNLDATIRARSLLD